MSRLSAKSMSVSFTRMGVMEDEGFLRDLEKTLQLPDTVLVALGDAGRADEDVAEAALDSIAAQHNVAVEDVRAAGGVLGFLRWANLPPASKPPVLEALTSAVADNPTLAELLTSRMDTLERVVMVGDEERLREFRRQAETGFMPCLTSFAGTWEIRPVVDDNEEVVDYVPVMVMKLESGGMLDDDFVVQITEKKFEKLRDHIDKMDNALSAIQAAAGTLRANLTPKDR